MINKLRFTKNILFALFLTLIFSECSKKEIDKKEEKDEYSFVYEEAKLYFREPLKEEYANKVGNEYSKEKVALGEKLYNDKRLSKDNTVSCATCHDLEKGGTDNLPTSVGIHKQKGDRNAPTVINAALHFRQFWDGRAKDVEKQAGMPILNPIEMGMNSEKEVEEKIRNIAEYQKLFKTVYPDLEQPITFKTITKSIASFERALIKPSKFDRFLAGNQKALNNEEKKGLYLFIYNKCWQCHSNLDNSNYANVVNLLGGLKYSFFGTETNPYWNYTKSKKHDLGRFEVTKKKEDRLLFKVPSLRNVEKTFPYFHDGSVDNLQDAIIIMAKIQFDVDLKEEDAKSIETFLKTLTSE